MGDLADQSGWGRVSLPETYHGLLYQATGDVRNRLRPTIAAPIGGEARQEARYPNNFWHSGLKKLSKTGM